MKTRVMTPAGSFPGFALHRGLKARMKKEWQVLAGDKNHWRVGYYCPPQSRASQLRELEKHTCVELFLLLQGNITLVLDKGDREYEIALEPMKPVMVSDWHAGYCPDGPHTGIALVVERDRFCTVYRPRAGGGGRA